MKKLLALLLTLSMVFALAACGGNDNKPSDNSNTQTNTPAPDANTPAPDSTTPAPAGPVNPDEIDDTMTSADNKYVIAMVTDVGQLKDKSFNQGTWNGVKLYASENGKSYKYYQPANGDNATDEDRYQAYKAAIDGGAEVIVAPGFLQEAAMVKAASEYPDVKFIFIDGYPLSDASGNTLANVVGVAFHEEQCGYLAGYAAVKEGNTKLGFTGGGGGTNPAVNRYGYGFVQGAQAAAAEDGVNVEMNYSYLYGDGYSASAELQTQINGWYSNGTEIVFACGGGIYTSAAEAAAKVGGKVIGVDSDQSSKIDTYGEKMTVTSAMKGLDATVNMILTAIKDGKWSEYAGKIDSLGMVSDEPSENFVQLPRATTQWADGLFTDADYLQLVKDIHGGKITISNDITAMPSVSITVNDYGRIK